MISLVDVTKQSGDLSAVDGIGLDMPEPRATQMAPHYNWSSALTAFRILFGDRIPDTVI